MKEGNAIFYKHQELVMITVPGRMGQLTGIKLNGAENQYKLRYESEKDFFGVFYFDPPVDVTLVREMNGGGRISVISLDAHVTKNRLEEVVSRVNFIPEECSRAFIIEKLQDFYVEKEAYAKAKQVAQEWKCDVERAYAWVKYATYLHRYERLSVEESLRAADLRIFPKKKN